MSYIGQMRKYIGHQPMLSAGATVVVIKDNRILLNLRSDTNTWGIPGGAIELGESLEETATRELKEETNLVAIVLPCSMFFPARIFISNILMVTSYILLLLCILQMMYQVS